MTTQPRGSLRRLFADWETYNERIVEIVRMLDATQLAVRPAPERWPIWATVAHTAGARVYWLCGVFGEPGADLTPFTDPLSGIGWEDDLDHPRSADELVHVLESSWQVIAGCLDRWTLESLAQTAVRERAGRGETHTRQSVLMRLLSHDAYHCGELSQTLGIYDLPQIDLWR